MNRYDEPKSLETEIIIKVKRIKKDNIFYSKVEVFANDISPSELI